MQLLFRNRSVASIKWQLSGECRIFQTIRSTTCRPPHLPDGKHQPTRQTQTNTSTSFWEQVTLPTTKSNWLFHFVWHITSYFFCVESYTNQSKGCRIDDVECCSEIYNVTAIRVDTWWPIYREWSYLSPCPKCINRSIIFNNNSFILHSIVGTTITATIESIPCAIASRYNICIVATTESYMDGIGTCNERHW